MWKRITALWTLFRGDARLLWFALRHPQAPGWLKLATGLLLLYVVSPIDLIPEWVPVLGVVDDLVLIPFAVRAMVNALPAAIRDQAQRRAGAGSRRPPA